MVGLITSPIPPAFDAPEETALKLGRLFGARIDWDEVRDEGKANRGKPKPELIDANLKVTRPIADARMLSLLPGPETAYAPEWHRATFRVPLGIRMTQYERRRDEAAQIWVREMGKQGYDLCTDSRLVVKPGPYPATDLYSGLPLLGEREVILLARFRWRTPDLATFELPADWFTGRAG